MRPIRHLSSQLRSRFKDHPAQGLVEFALALPILLLLVFGVIEFGRILQAWLALENGARFGVRYAITGSYDPGYCDEAGQALGLYTEDLNSDTNVDCVITPAGTATEEQKKAAEEKSNALQDWARLASIRDAALAGATGIAWDQTVSGDYLGYLDHAYETSALETTNRGSPNAAGYFGISICSNRFKAPSGDAPYGSAFMFNPNPFYLEPYPASSKEDYRYPIYCQQAQLNSSGQVTSNMVRYVDDAGGPGDRVRVVLTYRHRLITPFLSSWWPTLRLSTEREGLVEKFRVSRVTGLAGAIAFAPTWTYTAPPPTETSTPTQTPTRATCEGTGTILREWWEGVDGSSISNLTNHLDYIEDYPTGYNFPTSFDAPHNWKDNYGTRMRGYVCPPYTGTYTFYIASDDQSELYLSPNTDPDNKSRIAWVKSYTSYTEWGKYPEQKSVSINLVGGQFYYIEALQKEGGGGDSLSVAWTGFQVSPDDNTPTIIEGQYLKPYTRVDKPTRTPTPIPPPSCDQLENLTLSSGSQEAVTFQYITSGGYLLESQLRNNSPYNVQLYKADMSYNGAYHNEIQSPDPDRSFDLYLWDSNTTIYNPPNTTALSYGHTFPNPKVMNPGTSGWFKFTYDKNIFNFWATPAVPHPSGDGDPWGGSSQSYNFYWSSDFNGHLYYNIIPPATSPTVSCVMDLTGKTGPRIMPTFSQTSKTFTLRAVVEGNQGLSGNDNNVREVRFFVYNSAGQLVHWSKDTSKPYCIFGGSSSCTTREINVKYWSYGSKNSPYMITNDTYRFVILAENNDSSNRYKSAIIEETFNVRANTPTASRTARPTNTNTPVTPTTKPTNTKSPTPKTPTKTPTKSNTPRPATATNTSAPTSTPTKCQTPIELGGCR
ncbi:hypothetical protein ADN00_06590 [Ornatilinea apprima]|uniref:PA14 domain-containing protein n=1 Tax=Ornatilinea apprima TaxID=1134406 RepID=A0A0P6XTX9_9CHLR|nr:TadE/TadG family type IV pilus assembly protein [Ornatilinea apprima]KPL78583.1 hypothetical protein ADN00_06590 [Ornatilinea apprima]